MTIDNFKVYEEGTETKIPYRYLKERIYAARGNGIMVDQIPHEESLLVNGAVITPYIGESGGEEGLSVTANNYETRDKVVEILRRIEGLTIEPIRRSGSRTEVRASNSRRSDLGAAL